MDKRDALHKTAASSGFSIRFSPNAISFIQAHCTRRHCPGQGMGLSVVIYSTLSILRKMRGGHTNDLNITSRVFHRRLLGKILPEVVKNFSVLAFSAPLVVQ